MSEHLSSSNPLRDALRACRRHFIFAGVFSGLINVLYLVPSIYMLQVYDRVVPTRGTTTLLVLTVILAVSLIVFALLDAVRMRLLLRASIRLERMAASNILHRILGTGAASPLQRAQAMRDFDTLRGTLTGPAIVALFDAPWAPIYIAISYLLHPLIGLLALFSSLLLIGLAVWSDLATKKQLAETAQRSTATYRSQDYSIQASEVARALGMRDALVTRHLLERAEVVRQQSDVAASSGGFLAVTKFLRMLLQSLSLGLGAWLAIHQQISAGAIFAASLILGRALQPIEQILNAMKNVMSAQNAYKGLNSFCRLPDVTITPTALPAPQGRLEANGIVVRAPGTDRVLLHDLTFTINPGEIVALVGPSGAGKSTLLRVLSGALEPDEGEVRIDGARLADWNRENLGRHIGYMPQTPTLFPATVHGNISRFRAFNGEIGEALDREVVSAAQMAGAHDLILRFSNGYDTQLSVREGGGLSAGQRQVVALARALFGRPTLLFLDEPNAHLDMSGEARLMQTLGELRARGATVIVSTHRTGLLQAVDKVMLMRDGTIQVFDDRAKVIRPTSVEPVPEGRLPGEGRHPNTDRGHADDRPAAEGTNG
ncbi:type I secretion system permease/ATPase [Sphingomonas sp.]|uniref:type I secretion system permease/ATPase n=1 Tax=Sphingomonas sp. TaxID=28214 RepID=UPI002ED93089